MLTNKKNIFSIIILVIFLSTLISLQKNNRKAYLMKGTIYETPIYYLNNSNKKIKVVIVAGIHGNEIAGKEASNAIIDNKYEWAEMIIIPQANIEAFKLKVRNPYYMSDLNRAFPGKSNGTDTEKLANEIFNIIKLEKPDIVFDLHEWNNKYDEDSRYYTNGLILNSVDSNIWNITEKVYNEYKRSNKENKLVLNIEPPSGSVNREVSQRLDIPVLTIESNMSYPLEDRIEFQTYIIRNILKNYEMDERK